MPLSWTLTKDQIAHYRAEGYVLADSVLAADDLTKIDCAIEEVVDAALGRDDHAELLELEPPSGPGKLAVRRICDPYDRHANFRAIAGDSRILDRVESLLGPDFILQHSKLNMKPAGVGSPAKWHQDLAYYPHTNDDVLAVLIYLDDADEENGCLQVMAGAHDKYLNHLSPDGTFAGRLREPGDVDGTIQSLSAPAGSAIFLHGLLPHSSLPNRSVRSRRTLIFAYRAADAFPLYYGQVTAIDEAGCRPMRGRPARHARFGGPPPIVPSIDGSRSLYDLQATESAGTADAEPG
jgi:ectoine hydroxylase-related dioxygenase (phytanoyl-CoA dioxygenase family)